MSVWLGTVLIVSTLVTVSALAAAAIAWIGVLALSRCATAIAGATTVGGRDERRPAGRKELRERWTLPSRTAVPSV